MICEGFNIIKRNFRAKVILISILFMLVPCLSLTVFFVRQQGASLNHALIERGRLLARVLAHGAKMGVFSENQDLLKNPVAAIAQHPEVARVAVFNAEGDPLFVSEKDGSGKGPGRRMDNALFERLQQSPEAVVSVDPGAVQVWFAIFATSGFSNAESLYFESPGARTPKLVGFGSIVLGRERLIQERNGFFFKAVLMAAGAALLGSLLIFLVVKGITAPLNRLANGIRQLGTDGITEPVPVDTGDEIGRLALAFNEMAASLRKRTEEKFALEIQLRQAQKLEALGTLAGGIAHDFNNILSPIFGYTEMVLEDVAGNEALTGNLKQVLVAAGRARELVRQILAFSRQNDAGKNPVRIQMAISEAMKLLRASLPSTISITERIDNHCGPVLADPTDIHRVVMNLGVNAYHAMRDRGGELTVTLEEILVEEPRPGLEPGRHLKLSVKDTGGGMDREILRRIFDPYFTTKPAGEGTGMGLAMVHGIVTSCGGIIDVRSDPGRGTLFDIYLPRLEAGPAAVDIRAAQPVPGGNEHILIVDDDPRIAAMLEQMLGNLGYAVTARTSGPEALEAFTAEPDRFDAVITDQTMPRMTGDQLAVNVMRMREDIPVIICTGFSERITEEDARRKGVKCLLMKPVLRQEMATTLRSVLDGDSEPRKAATG